MVQSAAFPLPSLDQVPAHTGGARDPQLQMFVPPPPEIGQLRSAGSDLKASEAPWSPSARLAFVVGIFGVAALILAATPSPARAAPGVAIIASLVALFVWLGTAFTRVCSYVGSDGLAMATLTRARTGPISQQLLRFRDAVGMYNATTHHSTNGVYNRTTFNYSWKAADGRVLFKIAGQYHRKKIKPNSLVHFARAAEVSWNHHYLTTALNQLNQEGSIAFRVDAARVLRVGDGFLEFHFGGPPVRVTKAEIAKVTLGGGEFFFKHTDARWYSSEGKYKFNYANMANGSLFLIVLEKLMGYRWS